jgi:murein DD-endopeptidase MepM/ murein hydrolase activator NlpD
MAELSSPPFWLQNQNFHPVVKMPEPVYVHDFSQGDDPNPTALPFSIGRYNEKRRNMYTAPRYQMDEDPRDIHMGIDMAAPIGTPVYSFSDGEIFKWANNSAQGDYGPTLVIKYIFGDHCLYALYGHLSLSSLVDKKEKQQVLRGEAIGTIGDESENGGWFPHLHFQLSLLAPDRADLPGVVSEKDHSRAIQRYPDPRWVLGPLYQD